MLDEALVCRRKVMDDVKLCFGQNFRKHSSDMQMCISKHLFSIIQDLIFLNKQSSRKKTKHFA